MNAKLLKRPTGKDVFDRLAEDTGDRDTGEDGIEMTVEELTGTDDDTDDETGATEASDEDSDGAGESDTAAGPSSQRSRRRRMLGRVAIAAGALLFVAVVAVSGWLGWQLKQNADTAAAGHAALEVARTYAVTLTSVDNQDIDGSFARVLDGATGEFKDMYSQSSAQLRQLLVDNKAASKGIVIDAAVKAATTTKVDVMMFVDQSISNAVTPEPRLDRMRILMTLDLVDSRWLVSSVEIL